MNKILFAVLTVLNLSCALEMNNPLTIGTGLYLYTANYDNDTISLLQVDPTTFELTEVSDYSVGDTPFGIEVSRDEKCLLVANRFSDNVMSFSISSFNGKLTHVSTVSVGNEPYDIVIHPNFDKFYVSCIGTTDEVYTFDLNSDCTFSQSGSSATTNITSPARIKIFNDTLMIIDSVNSGITYYDVSTGTPSYITINFLGLNPIDFIYTGNGSTYNTYANAPSGAAIGLGYWDGANLSWPGTRAEVVNSGPNLMELWDTDTFLIAGSLDNTIMAFELNSTTGDISSKTSMALESGSAPSQMQFIQSNNIVFYTASGFNKVYSSTYDPTGHTLTTIDSANVGVKPFRLEILNLND